MALLHLLFLLLIRSFSTEAEQIYKCKGANYTVNSNFGSNLNLLLSNLSSTSLIFFPNTIDDSTNSVYGLVLCRGDLDPSSCNNCYKMLAQMVTELCMYSKEATVWDRNCELRYSDQPFFKLIDTDVFGGVYNIKSLTDTFANMVRELFDNVSYQAVHKTLNFFATGKLSYSETQIYSLAQCTMDISPEQCRVCLQNIFEFYRGCCRAHIGGWFVGRSCNYRYEVSPFYIGDPTLVLTLPSSSPSPAPTPLVSPPVSTPPLVSPLAPREAASQKGGGKKNTGKVLSFVISAAAALALIITLFICFWRRSRKNTLASGGEAYLKEQIFQKRKEEEKVMKSVLLREITSEESLLIDLSILKAATNNFSDANKLGQGGFGTVYKGTLPDGQEIAVKRLSATSRQGIGELKNELLLVAKLQHKNLVRLQGVCLEEEECLLVYEYVPNRSLDTFLFDPTRCKELSWGRRFKIIGGIARGLLYLHEESHLRVIHRDMKASNVLLDADLNPKIADFGLARLFGIDETQCITSHVVGTFGYMAPEYAMRGRLSVKSDVFSFGVMVLEILTGRKNSSLNEDEHAHNLPSYTWEHWIAGTICEIVDPFFGEDYSRNEVLRCFQVGLLCVQDVPAHRPLMSSVVLMLHSPSMPLEDVLQPRFAAGYSSTSDLSMWTQQSGSSNDVTISEHVP